MTTREPAQQRLTLRDGQSFERHKDEHVKLVDGYGKTITTFGQEEWTAIAAFFKDITAIDALL